MRTRVYKFGARTPDNAPDLRNQMTLGRDYYNTLVEAENKRRQTAWGSETVPSPPHDDCKCDLCKAHWKAVRKRVRVEPLLDRKPLRKIFTEKGLFWGTYLCIEDAFVRACKDRDVLKLVKFRSWREGGVVGVQVQKVVWNRNQGSDYFRNLSRPDNRTGRVVRYGGRKKVQLRMGSKGVTPIWSEEVAIEQHRAIEGRVAWVKVQMKYRNGKEEWHVLFTCVDVPELPASDEATQGIVAIDVGWRLHNDGMRIAYARDDRGNISEFTMDDRWLELTNRADRIRGHRDDYLVELKKRYPTFSKVRSCAGARRKIEELLSEKKKVTKYLNTWLHKDKHLSQYEAGCRRRSEAVRKDAMRKWARGLRRKYSTLIVKNSKTKKMKETAKKDGMHQAARRQGHHAAPGEVIDWLSTVFGRKDNVYVVPAKHTTNTCPECAHVNNHGVETLVTCEQCGVELDRDTVSTRNMMQLWVDGKCKAPTARKVDARFIKRHTKKEAA